MTHMMDDTTSLLLLSLMSSGSRLAHEGPCEHRWIVSPKGMTDYCGRCSRANCQTVTIRKITAAICGADIASLVDVSRDLVTLPMKCGKCNAAQDVQLQLPRPEIVLIMDLYPHYEHDYEFVKKCLTVVCDFTDQIVAGEDAVADLSNYGLDKTEPVIEAYMDLLGVAFEDNCYYLAEDLTDKAREFAASVSGVLKEELKKEYISPNEVDICCNPWDLPLSLPVGIGCDVVETRMSMLAAYIGQDEGEGILPEFRKLFEWALTAWVHEFRDKNNRDFDSLRPTVQLMYYVGKVAFDEKQGNDQLPRVGTDRNVPMSYLTMPDPLRQKYRDLELLPLFKEEVLSNRWRAIHNGKPSQHVALVNTDLSCWLNATLYPLYFIPDFRRAIASFRPNRTEWRQIEKDHFKTTPFPNQRALQAMHFIHRLQLVFSFLGPGSLHRCAFSFVVKEAFERFMRASDQRVNVAFRGCEEACASEFLFQMPELFEQAEKARRIVQEASGVEYRSLGEAQAISNIFNLKLRQYTATEESEEPGSSILVEQMPNDPSSLETLLQRHFRTEGRTFKTIESFPMSLAVEVGRLEVGRTVNLKKLEVPQTLNLFQFTNEPGLVSRRRELMQCEYSIEALTETSTTDFSGLKRLQKLVAGLPPAVIERVAGAEKIGLTLEDVLAKFEQIKGVSQEMVRKEEEHAAFLKSQSIKGDEEVPVKVARLLAEFADSEGFAEGCGKMARVLVQIISQPEADHTLKPPEETVSFCLAETLQFTEVEGKDSLVFTGRVAVLPEVLELLNTAADVPCDTPSFDAAHLVELDKLRGRAPPDHVYHLNAAVVYSSNHYWCLVRNRQQLQQGPLGKQLWLRCDDKPVSQKGLATTRGALNCIPLPPTPVSEEEAIRDIEGSDGKCAATLLFYVRANALQPDSKYDDSWVPSEYQEAITLNNDWLKANAPAP